MKKPNVTSGKVEKWKSGKVENLDKIGKPKCPK